MIHLKAGGEGDEQARVAGGQGVVERCADVGLRGGSGAVVFDARRVSLIWCGAEVRMEPDGVVLVVWWVVGSGKASGDACWVLILLGEYGGGAGFGDRLVSAPRNRRRKPRRTD